MLGVPPADWRAGRLVFQIDSWDAVRNEPLTTYACSESRLLAEGKVDSVRAAWLRASYEATC